MKTAALTTKIFLGSEHVPILSESQVYYVMLGIKANMYELEVPRPPINLCLVVDNSTSMKGEAINIVRRVINAITTWLKAEDHISIVSFNDRAETIIPPTRIADIGNISMQISKIHPKGGTEMYQGLKRGYLQLIRASHYKKSISHLVVISDGQTYGDEESCRKIVINMNKEGIILSAVGIGDEWNDELLDELVGLCGGEVRYSSRADQFPLEMEALITKLQEKSIPGLNIKWKPADGCQVKKVYRLDPEVMPLEINDGITYLGPIYPDKLTYLLVEMTIQPLSDEMNQLDLLTAELKLNTSVQDFSLHSAPINVSAPVRNGPTGTAIASSLLVQVLNMITLYRMQEKARKQIRSGNIRDGVWTLGNIAKQLKAQGNNLLGERIESEAEFVGLHHSYSQNGEKTIKYSTRLLPAVQKDFINHTDTRKVGPS